MDPITTTIVAAIGAGAAAGVTEVGKKAFADAYNSLKDFITSKFGQGNEVSEAISKLEQDHESKGRQLVLAEEMSRQEVDKDPEVITLATALRKALEESDAGGGTIAKYMIDAKGAQIGGLGDKLHVEGGIHFGEPRK